GMTINAKALAKRQAPGLEWRPTGRIGRVQFQLCRLLSVLRFGLRQKTRPRGWFLLGAGGRRKDQTARGKNQAGRSRQREMARERCGQRKSSFSHPLFVASRFTKRNTEFDLVAFLKGKLHAGAEGDSFSSAGPGRFASERPLAQQGTALDLDRRQRAMPIEPRGRRKRPRADDGARL